MTVWTKNSAQVMPVLSYKEEWMAIFIDTFNLFNATRLKFQGRALDYTEFVKHLSFLYPEEKKIIAYAARSEKTEGFIRFLQTKLNFFVSTKEIRSTKNDNFDVDITLDALDSMDSNLIICSSSWNLLPLLSRLHRDRRTVYVHATGIPRLFNDYCMTKELGLWMMKNHYSEVIDENAPAT